MDLEMLAAEMVLDGLDAEFVQASEDLPSDRVNVEIAVKGFDHSIRVQVTQVDTDPGQMPESDMFQLWAALPIELTDEGLERVTSFLPSVNTLTPLIGFNVLPDEKLVFFRHIGIVSQQPEALLAVVRSVWMAHYALDNLARPLAQMAAMGLTD